MQNPSKLNLANVNFLTKPKTSLISRVFNATVAFIRFL